MVPFRSMNKPPDTLPDDDGAPIQRTETMSAHSNDAQDPIKKVLLAGDIVDGKYQIERVLGEGGMGIVYLAKDITTEVPIVLKAIRAEYLFKDEYRERVRREARALARMDHPNVVDLKAVIPWQGTLILAMQYVDGKSLDKILAEHKARNTLMPVKQALDVFRQVAEGLAAVHAEGVIHRDLKPGNIMIRTRDGLAKVMDFGLAKTEDDVRTEKKVTTGIIGSLWYMAPEQIEGRPELDRRVDLYSLGILLHEMLIGRVPFDGPTSLSIMQQHIQAAIPSVHAARSEIPVGVDSIVARLCAKRPVDRFASCEELIAALDSLEQSPLAIEPVPPTRADRGRRPKLAIAFVLSLILGGVISMVGLSFWNKYYGSQNKSPSPGISASTPSVVLSVSASASASAHPLASTHPSSMHSAAPR